MRQQVAAGAGRQQPEHPPSIHAKDAKLSHSPTRAGGSGQCGRKSISVASDANSDAAVCGCCEKRAALHAASCEEGIMHMPTVFGLSGRTRAPGAAATLA